MNEKPNFFVGGYSQAELQDNLNALYEQGYEIINISSMVYQDSKYFTVVAQLFGSKRV